MDNFNKTENNSNPPEAPTEQPPETTPPSQPPVQPFILPIKEVESSSKKRIILAAIGAILVIAAIAVTGYMLIYNKPANNNASQAPVESKQPVKLDSAEAVAKAAKSVVKLTPVKVTVDNSTGFASVAPSNMTVYSYPTYQLPGRDFAAGPAAGHGLAVSAPEEDKAAIDKDYKALISMLEDGGFKTKKSLDQGDLAEGNKSVLYASNTTVCAVYALYYRETSYASIGCADMKSYEEHAKVAEPFYKALVAKLPEAGNNSENPFVFRGPMIKDGGSNYKIAYAGSANGSLLLFYQEPEKDWRYATGTASGIPVTCQSFDTPEAKKAFAGTDCYDTATEKDSTVKD